ncbi:MAG TPA: hypothetical protein ENJ42_05300 [Hellea balneolensis]|uniref:Uncharacterized protein n=1 Tax=Hellea balneolensis TaxID=287478 RepID=A0A7C5LZH9_9PROT|nr:hypothetical protein [Hellea balneolensis]
MTRHILKLLTLLVAVLVIVQPASAQNRRADPDLGGILEDILGGKRDGGIVSPRFGLIENIPVMVKYDQGNTPIPDGSMVVITAYAPPAPNERRAYPLVLGESRILLRSLYAPLQLVIAVPSTVTENIDYANIDARIIDPAGQTIFGMPERVQYRGRDQAVVNLRDQRTTTRPFPDENLVKFETVSGQVSIPYEIMMGRGANLVVRLVEDGLAGGPNQIIAGETRQMLDGISLPYKFSLTRPLNTKTADVPLVFDVWIEDWAGRKTFTLAKPVRFNGGGRFYDLPLVALTLDQPVTQPQPPAPVSAIPPTITGEARFDAYKGLPKGSVMIVELERQDYTARPARIASQRIPLDGLSGYIKFDLRPTETGIYDQNPKPRLRIRIEDKSGRVFFSNPGGTELKRGFQAIHLRAAPNY